MKKIHFREIEDILGFELSSELRKQISDFKLEYKPLTQEERDEYLLHVIDVLTSDITKSGEHRINEWENGWGENLKLFKESKDINDLIPKYHGKRKLLKWGGDVIKQVTENLDYKLHICMVDAILQHYLKDVDNVCEFGCGPAYHLIRLNKWKKDLKLSGSDWTNASQNIIKDINETLNTDIKGFNFNFFKPDYNINFPEKSGIYTVAALEQVGENFKDFINFLINKKPEICVHMEPIDELLDETKLIDNLTIRYFRKRNYLKGFLPYLEQLEKEGKIEIITKQRIFSGSYFIEGHSLIVWKVK